MEKWKHKMNPLLESMEQLDDIRFRIKTLESTILAFTKETKVTQNEESGMGEAALVKFLEAIQLLIENVEIKTNQLDMRLSAIERLTHE